MIAETMQKNRLRDIMPPPNNPFQSAGDWYAVEKRLGISLPDDYKWFISEYGCGQIGSFLSVFNPHCLNPYVNLVSSSVERLDALRVLESEGEKHPYSLYPDEDGILPVAGTDNGDTIFWVTNGLPDTWEIVANESRGPQWERFSCGLTDFLVGILMGTIQCSVFPRSFPGDNISFHPYDGNIL